MVCSGCCSMFRRDVLTATGGFPERTIVEDMDFTWSAQIAGLKARYVGDAVAWAADPETLTYLRRQVWRWMAGFFQNVRLHLRPLVRRKPMLALWVALAIVEILLAPLWWATPIIATLAWHHPPQLTLTWWAATELLFLTPPLLYAAHRRKLSFLRVLANIPFLYPTRAVNTYYAWKALIVELLLVPLGLARGLTTYEKGRPN
ncbi:glycosyltransferase [Spirillospora sp. CA-294931]|uniref:glycosyltransferase n=1 Tax=Spirillospora sp. CA-294931 TaxID=3240042 RepID=UPI003D8E3275